MLQLVDTPGDILIISVIQGDNNCHESLSIHQLA